MLKGQTLYNPIAVTKYEIEQLRKLRRIKEMSQEKLGKCIGSTKQYICGVEHHDKYLSREQYNQLLTAIQSYKKK